MDAWRDIPVGIHMTTVDTKMWLDTRYLRSGERLYSTIGSASQKAGQCMDEMT